MRDNKRAVETSREGVLWPDLHGEDDLDALTVDELEAELRRLDEERLALRARALVVRAARDRLIEAEQGLALAGSLTVGQRDALVRHLTGE